MAVMTTLPSSAEGWTVDDLPDDGGRLYELVDGALLVSPPPRLEHDDAASALDRLLAPLLPADLRVGVHRGVYFDRRNYRHPDVVVFSRSAARAKGRIEASDVRLAVEVVSPSSVSTDRVAKPAQYAAAGIPHYWRLELEPLLLVVHELAAGGYEEAGRFDEEVVVHQPVPVRFALSQLLD
jgi:Uma2 family endonuclease